MGAKNHIITDSAKSRGIRPSCTHLSGQHWERQAPRCQVSDSVNGREGQAGREEQGLFLASKERLAECVTKTGYNVGKEKKGQGPAQAEY